MKKLGKNISKKILTLSIISLLVLLMIFLVVGNTVNTIGITKKGQPEILQDATKEGTYYLSSSVDGENCIYLSDIDYVKEQSSAGWGSITKDGNLETQYNNGLITLLIEGEKKYFLKGISAHATSTLVYDLTDLDFDYFSAYVGLDESRDANGNGVKFTISTSEDGQDWTVQSTASDRVFKGTDNAELVTVNIKNAKYLKLYCDQYGNNTADHSVYANAKLYKEGYVEKEAEKVDFIKTVAEYDEILKKETLDQQIGSDEFTLLKREFVNRVGYDLLQVIVNQNDDYKETVKWLLETPDILHLYILGGEPDGGSYYNSIKELSRLYKEFKNDFDDKTPTNNKWYPELTKGEVYKKMAISLSLTHATKVGYWAQIDHPSNRSDSVTRYKIYKELYDGNKFKVSERQDQTDWYEALTVEEMRYVMNNITDDEELIWFNDYTQKRINEHPNEEEKYLQPHTYIAYVWPDFENEIFHDPDKKQYWDDFFEGIFTDYNVTYSTPEDHVYKAWMSMRNEYGTGAVCGGISKLGCHIRAAHGTPASVISQPGHAAIIYYRKYDNGDGYWTIDNDVSGWAQSGKTEKLATRMPLGWGNDSYVDGWAATYIVLAQEAINDNDDYEKAEKILMTASLYEGNLEKQKELYRAALDVQNINIDAWWGLINAYKADSTKDEDDYYELAKEIGEALKPFPLPMKNLLDQIAPKITTVEGTFKFTLLESKLLNEGKVYDSTDVVSQPGITRTVATFLLGQTDTSLASFSFDGVDAGKIVLSSRYDGTGVRWDYSLDGQQHWTEKDFTADEEHKLKLSKEEIESITAENDIYVHIVGTNYEEANIFKIDITDQKMPDLYANDLENRVIGVTNNMEWRIKGEEEWTSYSEGSPKLTGDAELEVRVMPTGTSLKSEPVTYKFTDDNQPNTRKYIPVSLLSIDSVSTEATAQKRFATNAIDGDYNTNWHSDWNGRDTQRYIVIKIDRPVYLSAVEFVPAGGGNGKILDGTIYGSTDGETWVELAKQTNLKNDESVKNFEIEEPQEITYVKIEANRASNGNWFTARMFNLFQDITNNPEPTATIEYSEKEPTSNYVTARLVNPSTDITITNNNGSDTYLFTDNGEFTFEFVDNESGVKGSTTAKVDWIDKNGPTADIGYKFDGDRNLSIILDNISEDAYLVDENNNKLCFIEVKDKKICRISYIDSSGRYYKIVELDAEGNVLQETYLNTTGEVSKVKNYVTILKNGELSEERFIDEEGNNIEITDAEKETLRKLKQVKANPLEFTFEGDGEYQYKLLDKASNLTCKSIRVDYSEDGNIIASDISYDITKRTNKNVVATINPYIISGAEENGATKLVKQEAKLVNSGTTHTFEDNGEFTFKYKDPKDTAGLEVKQHTAKVDWIDKVAPTATIEYSTEELTSGKVVARLTDESEEIVIVNNNTSRKYTFDKNGNFTFKFEDSAGNEGKAIAKVNWISPGNYRLGDANLDDEITATDVLLVKRHLVAGTKQEWIIKDDNLAAADYNQDGKITATDLLLIQRLVLSEMKEQE